MDCGFSGEIWYWRGPSPYHFVTVPEVQSDQLRSVAGVVTYGWGMIPVRARVGTTTWDTSLYPKDGRYIVPVKDAVRHGEGLEVTGRLARHSDVDVHTALCRLGFRNPEKADGRSRAVGGR